jgi:hypothetical protein
MSKELAVDPVALREEVKTNNRMTPRGSEGEKKARLLMFMDTHFSRVSPASVLSESSAA